MIEDIESLDQLTAVVSRISTQRILPIGNATKLRLTEPLADETRLIRLAGYSGINTYEPSEYLVSARSGTRIAEIVEALAEHGQYLPFDPLYVDQGATLGGTLAGGFSGPCQMLYGSLRDFAMEIQFVDGLGRVVRSGGKVVKNAAGFDFPKLMVGSQGRLGVLTEVTMKVFPQPAATVTCVIELKDLEGCLQVSQKLLGQPLPISAIDFDFANSSSTRLIARFAGPGASLPKVLERAQGIATAACAQLSLEAILEPKQDQQFWQQHVDFLHWHAAAPLIRVALDPTRLCEFDRHILQVMGPVARRYSGGGTVGWIQCNDESTLVELGRMLCELRLAGALVPSAPGQAAFVGNQDWKASAARVQHAFDPNGKFVAF